MVDSTAVKAAKGLARRAETLLYGHVGNIPKRAISEEDLDRGVRTGAGRADIRKTYGWAAIPVRGRELDTQLTTGAGRKNYADRLRRSRER